VSRTFGGIENTQVIDSVISLIAPFASFARWVARFGTISHTPKLRPSLECCHIPPSDLADELNDPFDVERRRPLLSACGANSRCPSTQVASFLHASARFHKFDQSLDGCANPACDSRFSSAIWQCLASIEFVAKIASRLP
jgi:hypothetical protein